MPDHIHGPDLTPADRAVRRVQRSSGAMVGVAVIMGLLVLGVALAGLIATLTGLSRLNDVPRRSTRDVICVSLAVAPPAEAHKAMAELHLPASYCDGVHPLRGSP